MPRPVPEAPAGRSMSHDSLGTDGERLLLGLNFFHKLLGRDGAAQERLQNG